GRLVIAMFDPLSSEAITAPPLRSAAAVRIFSPDEYYTRRNCQRQEQFAPAPRIARLTSSERLSTRRAAEPGRSFALTRRGRSPICLGCRSDPGKREVIGREGVPHGSGSEAHHDDSHARRQGQ